MNLTNLEADFIAQGGKWEEFAIGDLFEKVEYTKLNLKKSALPKESQNGYDLPAITCTTQNNGISCYVPRFNATIFKNCISVAANGDAPAFYQPHDFTILQDAYVLKFKGKELSHLHYLYLVALLQKILAKFDWTNKSGWEKVKLENIILPVDSEGKIAFDFMESYIKELEAERINEMEVERIQELEAYLEVTGLNDYELNAQEREALAIFASSLRASEASVAIHTTFCHLKRSEVSHKNSDRDISAFSQPQYDNVNSPSRNTSGARGWVNPHNDALNLQWREFSIGDLFEVSTPKKKFNANTLTFNGKYPYIARGAGNNGIRGYIDKDTQYLNEANTISFGQDTATMFYQPNPYFTGDKIKIFKPKILKFDKHIAHFIIPALKIAFSSFSWGSSSYKESVLENMTIKLPVNQNNQIAFDFMEKFISAVQKEVIKSVVLWKQKRIDTTKAIVKNR